MRRAGSRVGAWAMVVALSAVVVSSEGSGASSLPVPGQSVCYTRTYDAGHLAQHPQQLVADISISVRFEKSEAEAHFPFRLTARVKGHAGVLRATGDCAFQDPDGLEISGADFPVLSSTERVVCSVEPDHGGVVIEARPKSSAALLSFGSFKHVGLQGPCGGPSCAVDLVPGADDRTFLLDKTTGSACKAEVP